MKRLATILLLISLQATARTICISPNADGGRYLVNGQFAINPGDTVRLTGKWTYFSIEGYHGTAKDTIVIAGDATLTGLSFKHCTYIKLTGSLKVKGDGSGVAIAIFGKSSNILVENVQVYHTAYGAWIKNEVDCDTSLNYPNTWLSNIELRNCSFKNIGQDCIYAGSTGQLSTDRPITCSGVVKYYIPSRLRNISIHDNQIDSCNRTGIQLSGAMEGENLIYNNTVTDCGYELDQRQGTGISIGGMSHAKVYNNTIKNTFLYGIMCQGIDTVEISGNNVDSSGYLNGIRNTGSFPCNILLTTKTTDPFRTTYAYLRDNSLGINATNEAPNGNISFANWGPNSWVKSLVCNNRTPQGNMVFVSTFQGFPGYMDCTVLPVHIITFAALRSGKSVLLKWTADETGVQYYEIQRSQNGKDFYKIAKVYAGTFQAIDLLPLEVGYYRLKVVGEKTIYSPVRRVTFKTQRQDIYSTSGQLISHGKENLQAGFYIIRYEDGTKEYYVK